MLLLQRQRNRWGREQAGGRQTTRLALYAKGSGSQRDNIGHKGNVTQQGEWKMHARPTKGSFPTTSTHVTSWGNAQQVCSFPQPYNAMWGRGWWEVKTGKGWWGKGVKTCKAKHCQVVYVKCTGIGRERMNVRPSARSSREGYGTSVNIYKARGTVRPSRNEHAGQRCLRKMQTKESAENLSSGSRLLLLLLPVVRPYLFIIERRLPGRPLWRYSTRLFCLV